MVLQILLIIIKGYKFPTHTQHEFLTFNILNCVRQTKYESKIYINYNFIPVF